jgi:hypothetical protein
MAKVYVDIPWKRGSEGAQAALKQPRTLNQYKRLLSKWENLLAAKKQLQDQAATLEGVMEDHDAADPRDAHEKRFGANRSAIRECEADLASLVDVKDLIKGKGKKYVRIVEEPGMKTATIPTKHKADVEELIERAIAQADDGVEATEFASIPSSTTEVCDRDFAVFSSYCDSAEVEVAELFSAARQGKQSIGTAVDAIEHIMSKMKTKNEAFKVKWPDRSKICDDMIEYHIPTMSARRTALLDSLRAIPEDWEQMISIDDRSPLPQPNANDRLTLLNGCKCDTPFQTAEKPEYEQIASHPQLNTSRIIASTALYIRAAKCAQAALEANRNATPVVVDVGAGAFGCERLSTLHNNGHYPGVYFHCMVPNKDHDDPRRHESLRASRSYAKFNFVPQSGRISLNTLNYCFHTAATCTCLAKYSPNPSLPMAFPVCIHASYYFQDEDWVNLLKYASDVRVAEHTPDIGMTIPQDKPEYIWQDGSEVGSYLQRLQSKFRAKFRGAGDVVLAPLKGGETTYRHVDTSVERARGGFHVTPLSDWANRVTDGRMGTCIELGKSAIAGAACSIAKSLISATMPTPAGVCVTAAACAAATLAGGYIEKMRMTSAEPPWNATATVSFHNNCEYALKDTHEPIVTIYVVKRSKPRTLTPQCVRGEAVDADHVNRAAAAMLMGRDNEKSKAQVAATLLRDKLPVWAVKSTVQHAERVAGFLGRRTAQHVRPPSPLPTLLATISLPFALGCARMATSTLLAKSSPLWQRSLVTAQLLYWITTILPLTLTLCLVFALHLGLRFLEDFLLGLVALG